MAIDFTAFFTIAKFDNYLAKRLNSYAEIDDISYICLTDKEYLDKLLMIETTTSNNACANRNVNLKEDPVLIALNKKRRKQSKKAAKSQTCIKYEAKE